MKYYQRKTVTSTLFLSSLIGLLVGGIIYLQHIRSVEKALKQIYVNSANQLVKNISFYVKINNIPSIHRIVYQSSIVEHAKCIQIYDEFNDLMYSSQHSVENYSENCQNSEMAIISYNKKQIGKLYYTIPATSSFKIKIPMYLIAVFFFAIATLSYLIYSLLKYNTLHIVQFIAELDNINPSRPSFPDKPRIPIKDKVIISLYKKISSLLEDLNKVSIKNIEFQKEASRRDRLTAIGRTAQLFAHDVRKPFSVLKMLICDLYKIKDNPASIKEAEKEVSRMISNVDSMVSDIIDYSREAKIECFPTPLIFVLESAIRYISRSFEGKKPDIRFVYNLNHTFKPLLDPDRMERVFINILSNAVEAITEIGGRESGEILVDSELVMLDGHDGVRIIIANDGPQLNEKDIPYLFDFVFTNGKKHGVGLGLAGCHKIVKLHHGDIYAGNRNKEQGVEFIITIPASGEADGTNTANLPENINSCRCLGGLSTVSDIETPAGQSGDSGEQQGTLLKILLLDDEAFYRKSVRHLVLDQDDLKRQFSFFEAGNVEEAVSIVKNNPDMRHALVDHNLGGDSNGLDFVKRIKLFSPELSILIHSDNTLLPDDEGYKELGVGFTPKPLNIADFMSFIGDIPASKTTSNKKHGRQSYNVLLVDDDPHVMGRITRLLKDYFDEANQMLNLTTANTFRQAKKLLASPNCRFTHILSDLNICSSNDGLLLAEKTRKLNEHLDCQIYFSILTHADINFFGKHLSPQTVESIHRHPIDTSTFDAIFQFGRTDFQERLQPNRTIPVGQSTIEFGRKAILESSDDVKWEDRPLPDVIKCMNPKLLNRMCRILAHNVVGELNVIKHNIVCHIRESEVPDDMMKNQLFTIARILEQMSSFLDIAKYVRADQLEKLFIVPFKLKLFIDQFIERHRVLFQNRLKDIELINRIDNSEIAIVGDELVFEKVVLKVLLNAVKMLAGRRNSEQIVFETESYSKKQVMTLTINSINNSIDENFINQLFYNTPSTSDTLNLDFAACGYLMSLQNGNITVKLDCDRETTTFCFALDKRPA